MPPALSGASRHEQPADLDPGSAAILRRARRAGLFFFATLAGLTLFLLLQPLSSLLIETWKLLIASVQG